MWQQKRTYLATATAHLLQQISRTVDTNYTNSEYYIKREREPRNL